MTDDPGVSANISSRIAAWRSTFASCLGDRAHSTRSPCGVGGSAHYGVFVNNLPLHVSREELCRLFEPYSRVQELVIVRRPEFKTHCFGYVLLDSDDDTKLAIQQLNGTLFGGLRIKVEATFGKASHIFGSGDGRVMPVGQDYKRFPRRDSWEPDYRVPNINGSGRYGNGNARFPINGGYRPQLQDNAESHGNGRNFNPNYDRRYGGYRNDNPYNAGISVDAAREITRKMRYSWERHLASVPEDEDWPSFNELLEKVRFAPNRVPFVRYPRDYSSPDEHHVDQPTFWPISDDEEEGCKDAEHYQTILDVLRRRHGDKEIDDFLADVMPGMDANRRAQDELETNDAEDLRADCTLPSGRLVTQIDFTEKRQYVHTRDVGVSESMPDDEKWAACDHSNHVYLPVSEKHAHPNGEMKKPLQPADANCERSSRTEKGSPLKLSSQQESLLAQQKRILDEVEERINRILAGQAKKLAVQDEEVLGDNFSDVEHQVCFQEALSGDDCVLENDAGYQAEDDNSQDSGCDEDYKNMNAFENSSTIEEVNATGEEVKPRELLKRHFQEELGHLLQPGVITDSCRDCPIENGGCPVYEDVADDSQEAKGIVMTEIRHASQSLGNGEPQASNCQF